MEKIEAGLLKKLLDAIQKISEKLFNYLGAADDFEKEGIKIDDKNIKKVNEETFDMPCYYNTGHGEIPYTVRVKLNKEKDLADITVTYDNDGSPISKTKRNVSGDEYVKESKKIFLSLLDKDTKEAFGIKSSKTMQVTLQKITASEETSINLTAIKANYVLGDAYANLDVVLDNDDFIDTITEEPVSFEIVEYDDEFDINPIDIQQNEYTAYSIQQLLCSHVQFYMDIQQLRWESARNQKLFNIIGSMLYSAQNWVDKLGLWYIEVSNSVCNVLSNCKPDLGANIDISSDHSPCMECVGMEYVFPIFDRLIDTIEWNFPNFPTDMQQDLNWWLRDLKRTRDFDLKQM